MAVAPYVAAPPTPGERDDVVTSAVERCPVLGVIGGTGGVGASSFAAALAGRAGATSLLLDLDPGGGGIDVLVGLEDAPGARWSELRLGGGRLDPWLLLDGVPGLGGSPGLAGVSGLGGSAGLDGVRVLAADTDDLDPPAVAQVIDVASQVVPVVLDLPRWPGAARDTAVAWCDLVVVVVRNDVAGLVAARAVLRSLAAESAGAVVRRVARGLPPAEAAALVGLPLLGSLGAPAGIRARRTRGVAAIADGILRGVVARDGHGPDELRGRW